MPNGARRLTDVRAVDETIRREVIGSPDYGKLGLGRTLIRICNNMICMSAKCALFK